MVAVGFGPGSGDDFAILENVSLTSARSNHICVGATGAQGLVNFDNYHDGGGDLAFFAVEVRLAGKISFVSVSFGIVAIGNGEKSARKIKGNVGGIGSSVVGGIWLFRVVGEFARPSDKFGGSITPRRVKLGKVLRIGVDIVRRPAVGGAPIIITSEKLVDVAVFASDTLEGVVGATNMSYRGLIRYSPLKKMHAEAANRADKLGLDILIESGKASNTAFGYGFINYLGVVEPRLRAGFFTVFDHDGGDWCVKTILASDFKTSKLGVEFDRLYF